MIFNISFLFILFFNRYVIRYSNGSNAMTHQEEEHDSP